MTNLKQRLIVIGVILLVLVLGIGKQYWTTEPETEPFYAESQETVSEPVQQEIMVHVAGAVKQPGVYRLQEGQRVEDAVQLAGVTAEADLDALNRAARITDGQKIVVPSLQAADQTAAAQPMADDRVDLNQADLQQLMSLPGIGQVKAQAIITYRTEHNGFQTIEEIQQVNGIGSAIFSQIKNQIKI